MFTELYFYKKEKKNLSIHLISIIYFVFKALFYLYKDKSINDGL
jgi:hypothetical protein